MAATMARTSLVLWFLLLPACHTGTDTCRPEGYPREFGQRTQRFGAFLASRPEWFVADLEYRGDQHARWWERKKKRFADEVETTLEDGYPHLIDDARSHAPSLKKTVSSWWGQLKDDTHCALDRFWYDLKILD